MNNNRVYCCLFFFDGSHFGSELRTEGKSLSLESFSEYQLKEILKMCKFKLVTKSVRALEIQIFFAIFKNKCSTRKLSVSDSSENFFSVDNL
jgi:hypothetical protein